MPPSGVVWKSHREILSFEEMFRSCRILAELGIHTIKVTGGDPLVRKGAAAFTVLLKTIPDLEQLTLTTNGLLLDAHLEELARAGLDGINISLDTLDPERYRLITGGEGLLQALSAIDRVPAMGIPVKINCVPIRNINEGDLAGLAALARHKNITVRFIELMPLGCAGRFEPVPGDEVIRLLEKQYGRLTPVNDRRGNGPAVYYTLEGFSGKIGFINPLSRGFCGTCNRIRLTAEGLLKPCLAGDISLDLKALLRGRASDGDIKQAVRELAGKKPLRHNFHGQREPGAAAYRAGEMFRIGG
jgi:cyclic pyranopterin phosphate synthase